MKYSPGSNDQTDKHSKVSCGNGRYIQLPYRFWTRFHHLYASRIYLSTVETMPFPTRVTLPTSKKPKNKNSWMYHQSSMLYPQNRCFAASMVIPFELLALFCRKQKRNFSKSGCLHHNQPINCSSKQRDICGRGTKSSFLRYRAHHAGQHKMIIERSHWHWKGEYRQNGREKSNYYFICCIRERQFWNLHAQRKLEKLLKQLQKNHDSFFSAV